ncbi:Beige/BEACH domain containing protein [Histomonas meleagridis]|uniref:Beige/BEACH domain containing protein n=1 Tax=Histomonas meleagridis TaxID=135588 RepID=UPI00355A9A45|nr:Beige/BEACH domain containing protein [Histomonas meleagridis]KAH0798878.1 Beige/BEACH domain containing protein [Histomonas meleagridis]
MCVSELNDFRELIPEFFSTPEFLINSQKYDLGEGVDDVELAKWAKTPAEFIAINRLALESAHVSKNINQWIDLIFGVKQQSLEALNLFHPYSDSTFFDKLKEPEQIELAQQYALSFGVNPQKLFASPHPQRTFIPFMPDFSSEKSITFSILEQSVRALKIWCSDQNDLNYAVQSGQIYSTNFDKTGFKVISKFTFSIQIPPKLSSIGIFNKFTSVRPEDKLFFFASPWSDTFDVVNYAESKGKTQTFRGHSASILSICGGSKYVISAAQDFSLCVWDIQTRRITGSVHAHFERIECLAYSEELDLIVSVDVSLKFAYSSAINHAFNRSIKVRSLPSYAVISDLGFVILISERKIADNVKTKLSVFDLSQRNLRSKEVDSSVTTYCKCTFPDRSEYLCLAMKSKDIILLRVYDLKTVAKGWLPNVARSITFSSERRTIYALLENNELVASQPFQ